MAAKKKKLFLPQTVSYDLEKGFEHHGTKAFVEGKRRFPKGVARLEMKRRFEVRSQLRELAQKADYFIRPITPKQRRIRRAFKRAGIETEKVIQDLKDGTFLVERTGFALSSPRGREIFLRKPFKYLMEIEKAVAKMHSLGITHNHLHSGNITITREGKIALIDLSEADITRIPRKITAEWAVKTFQKDLWELAENLKALVGIGGAVGMDLKDYRTLEEEIVANVLAKYPREMQRKLGTSGIDKLLEKPVRKRQPLQ